MSLNTSRQLNDAWELVFQAVDKARRTGRRNLKEFLVDLHLAVETSLKGMDEEPGGVFVFGKPVREP